MEISLAGQVIECNGAEYEVNEHDIPNMIISKQHTEKAIDAK